MFTLFNIQRPYLWSHCELYNVIKKAGRASKQMDMKQTLDNNIFIEAKMEAHKINDYICKTGGSLPFFLAVEDCTKSRLLGWQKFA